MTYVECPECCYAVSSSDEHRAITRVEDHMDKEHPESHKQVIVTEEED